MVELVRLDPPPGRFHEKFRVVILVRKEGVEREAHIRPLGRDLLVANLSDLFSQTLTHEVLSNPKTVMLGLDPSIQYEWMGCMDPRIESEGDSLRKVSDLIVLQMNSKFRLVLVSGLKHGFPSAAACDGLRVRGVRFCP